MTTHRMQATVAESKLDPVEVALREFGRPFMGHPGIMAGKTVTGARWTTDLYGPVLVIEYK